jgi:hypothetical protein
MTYTRRFRPETNKGSITSQCGGCDCTDLQVLTFDKISVLKVRCLECGWEGMYRPLNVEVIPEPPELLHPAANESECPIKTLECWKTLLKLRLDSGEKIYPYDVMAEYVDGDLIQHPNFGKGVVISLQDQRKMKVLFRDRVMLLARKLGDDELDNGQGRVGVLSPFDTRFYRNKNMNRVKP